MLEIISFTYNSCTKYDFRRCENIFGENINIVHLTLTAGGHIYQLVHMMTYARTHASRTLYIAPTVFYYSVVLLEE